jgi:hypothetical protein
LVLKLRVLVDIAQTLLVLIETERIVARLEGSVAVLLAGLGDLDDGDGVESVGAVFGEVLVGVAKGVGLLHVGSDGGVTLELAAVGNESLLCGAVAGLGGKVLDLSNDGLAVKDLSEDDMLAVEVRGRNGGYEELGAVGVWRGNSSAS